MNENNKNKTRGVVVDFIREYRRKPLDETNTQWLNRQFAKYPDLWSNAEERQRDEIGRC